MTNEKMENAVFHLQLLSKTVHKDEYPFVRLIIDHNLTDEEYEEILQLCQELEEKYKAQKEEGLIDFTSLLIHFSGMLNAKLNPTETIKAMKKEGYYTSLMEEFIRIIDEFEKKGLC